MLAWLKRDASPGLLLLHIFALAQPLRESLASLAGNLGLSGCFHLDCQRLTATSCWCNVCTTATVQCYHGRALWWSMIQLNLANVRQDGPSSSHCRPYIGHCLKYKMVSFSLVSNPHSAENFILPHLRFLNPEINRFELSEWLPWHCFDFLMFTMSRRGQKKTGVLLLPGSLAGCTSWPSQEEQSAHTHTWDARDGPLCEPLFV